MSQDTVIPEAPAFLKRVPEGIGSRRKWVNLWVVPKCPHCGKRHVHGGGYDVVDDPRRALSHRVAHCIGGSAHNPGYTLVEQEGTSA